MTNQLAARARHSPPWIEQFTPKLISALKEGYGLADLRADAISGLTVAIVALPLAMAIGIASGTTPDRALVTAIVAGALISALGGSRVQIGGPTAAFIVVVFNVIQTYGIDGLVLATFLAGLILIIVGLLRLAVYIKYIPYPVIVGVTAGIAVSIFMAQVKELLGVNAKIPGDFIGKVEVIWASLPTARPHTIVLSLVSLAVVIGVKRFMPRIPNMLVAVLVGSLAAAFLGLDVDTIGSRFGGVPQSFPTPTLPDLSWERVIAILPSAGTIALLAGIESLLSAVIADGLTGRRHRSNCELVAQGVANCVSALFGGISATGAIARTATNIRSGGRTPVAGILHAVFLLSFMLVAAPLLSYVPLATLAAILSVVAWNIAEADAIIEIFKTAPNGDRLALLVSFLLSVFADITLAIEVGIVLSALFFMHRMAEAVAIDTDEDEGRNGDDPPSGQAQFNRAFGKDEYLVYRIRGPFFFGAASKVIQTLERVGSHPRAFILDFTAVPFVDSTALASLSNFAHKVSRAHAKLIIAGAEKSIIDELKKNELADEHIVFAPSVKQATESLATS